MRRSVVRLASPRVALRAPQRAAVALQRAMANKRKRSSGVVAPSRPLADSLIPELPRSRRSTTDARAAHVARQEPQPPHRLPSRGANVAATNPSLHPEILDGVAALRASPDSGDDAGGAPHLKPRTSTSSRAIRATDAGAGLGTPTATLASTYATTEIIAAPSAGASDPQNGRPALGGGATANSEPYPPSETPAADPRDHQPGKLKSRKAPARHVKVETAESNIHALNFPETNVTRDDAGALGDPEDRDEPAVDDEGDAVKEVLSRPPPVNSDYLPLPWKGRLGYVRTVCTWSARLE